MNHRIHVMSHELIYQLCYHKSATYIYIYPMNVFPMFRGEKSPVSYGFPMVFPMKPS